MVLAGEAAEKIDKCTTLFKYTYKEGHLNEIKEYKDLRHFYLSKIVKRFQEVFIHEEAWEEEWGVEDVYLNIEKLGLKDLETVKRDREYELFYIRQDDGKPFFNRNLLRHIKLVSDFDEVVSEVEGEDPLLKISLLLDREAQAMAEDLKADVEDALGDFYIDAMQYKEIPIIGDMNCLVMSLMLAANPQNLLQNTIGKTCTRYFHDFHQLLRELLSSAEYLRLISHSMEEADRLSRALMTLVHTFCQAFLTRIGKWQLWKDFIYDLIKVGYRGNPPPRTEKSDTLNFFSDLLDHYDIISSVLKRYPSGPLFKTLDIFHEREEKEGFDPSFQGNHPELIYTFSSQSFDAKCLRLPCPTYHKHINKAEVNDEFMGYLRFLEAKKSSAKHLMINLQDRTSWEEHARCQALEELQKRAEYSGQFALITLPKRSDFYYQSDAYLEIEASVEFLKLIQDQVDSGEECGFFFSHLIDKKELMDFVKQVLPLIHSHFFEEKKILSRKDRLDFIEIFYLLLSLKILDIIKPDYFSFTCKDAVDVGQTMAGSVLLAYQDV